MINKSKKILSEISVGELLDKISILEIKLEKIKDKESQIQINKLYAQRKNIYKLAKYRINCNNLSKEDIAKKTKLGHEYYIKNCNKENFYNLSFLIKNTIVMINILIIFFTWYYCQILK